MNTEKINAEELMEKFNLKNEDLESIAGGAIHAECFTKCLLSGYDTEKCQKLCTA